MNIHDTSAERERIDIYASGLFYCSVCAPPHMTAAEVEAAVNAEEPTTITVWTVADENFGTGEANPHERNCGRHWLLSC